MVAAVNIVKREPDGSWRGDMVDGLGFLNGLAAAGIPVEGQRALLVGAGGAGSAIAHSLLEAGLGGLSIYDTATERSADLIDRLAARGHHSVQLAKRADPSGHTLVVNATPLGMRRGDPFPVNVEKLTSDMAVADVITAPETTPLLEAAACRGCAVQNGTAMYRGLQALLAAIMVGNPRIVAA